MEIEFLLAALSGVAVLNAIFFGFALLINGKGLQKNILLAGLLLGIGLRTGKSIILLLFPSAPDSVPSIGLIGMALIGPLLYLYIQNVAYERQVRRNQWFHFVQAALIAAYLPIADPASIFWLYFITVAQLAAYLSWITHNLVRQDDSLRNGIRQWIMLLVSAVTVNWLVYLVQLFFQGVWVYLAATFIASAALFVLALYGFRHSKVFARSKGSIRSTDNQGLSEEIIHLMEDKKLYRDSDLTIARLAEILKVKPYIVSIVLNEYHEQTFPEFVNQYRIREAKELLASPTHQFYSIEAIAFDCGFNTPSAFYAHFKKLTKLTPSAYRSGQLERSVAL